MRLVGLLRGVGGEGQFPDQKVGKGWRRERIVGRREGGHFRGDRSRIHRGKVFRDLGLFEEVRKIQ